MQRIQYLETLKTLKTVSKDVTRSKSQPHPRIKGSIFATTVTVANKKMIKEQSKRKVRLL